MQRSGGPRNACKDPELLSKGEKSLCSAKGSKSAAAENSGKSQSRKKPHKKTNEKSGRPNSISSIPSPPQQKNSPPRKEKSKAKGGLKTQRKMKGKKRNASAPTPVSYQHISRWGTGIKETLDRDISCRQAGTTHDNAKKGGTAGEGTRKRPSRQQQPPKNLGRAYRRTCPCPHPTTPKGNEGSMGQTTGGKGKKSGTLESYIGRQTVL